MGFVEAAVPEGFHSFDQIEERMVEAMELWWRAPDRERGWLHVKAAWPEIRRFPWRVGTDGEHDEREAVTVPRRPNPSREQIAEMEEASEWLLLAPERDRKLVAIVIAWKLRHPRKRVPWRRIRETMGVEAIGSDGLSRRYSRAIGAIAKGIEGARRGAVAANGSSRNAL